MANPQRGEVAITVGDTEYTLKLGRNALASAEGVLGKPFPEIARQLQEMPDLGTMRAMFWAGLHAHHPALTLFDVGDLMDEIGDDEVVVDAIGEALALAFPKAKAEAARPRKPGRTSTGTPT